MIETRTRRLAFTRAEAAAVLDAAGLCLRPEQLDRVLTLTEGWPAAVQLIAGVLREHDDVAVGLDGLGGDDSVLAGYLRDEVLASLSRDDRAFLRGVSVLDQLSAQVCDVLVRRRGSGVRLRRIADAGAPLFPVDRAHLAYRMHPLLAQASRAELRCLEPDLEPRLHRRAGVWYERRGDAERAIEHALASGDVGRVELLLRRHAPPRLASGRAALVDSWLAGVARDDVEACPALALLAGAARLGCADGEAAERWAEAALAGAEHERDVLPAVSALRAALARDGIEQMLRDAEIAYAAAPLHGLARAFACALLGGAQCLAGSERAGCARLDEGARTAGAQAPVARELCLALRALVTLQQGELAGAAQAGAAARASLMARLPADDPAVALTLAVSAAVLAQTGAIEQARDDVAAAVTRLTRMPDAPSWLVASAQVAAARAQLRLGDGHAARQLLGEASRRLRGLPDARALRAWVEDGWARADDFADHAAVAASALTRAELRILRLLPTHLTFREIAARLHVSRNTVKTQAHAVYHKLDVSSRSEAVEHARRIGLVDL